MRSVSVAKAKAELPSLLAAANAGERIVVTKHGKPIAEIVAPKASAEASQALLAADLEWLDSVRVVPDRPIDSAALIRAIRDETDAW